MTVNWITNVYTQERSILTCSNFDSTTVAVGLTVVTPSSLGITAKWVKPSSGVLQADLSDLVRLTPSGGAATIYELDASGNQVGSSESITWTIAGRIRPRAAIIPPSKYAYGAYVTENEIGIMAPSVMLRSFKNDVLIQFEMANTGSGYQFSTGRIKFPPLSNAPINFAREVAVPNGADVVSFWHLDSYEVTSVDLKDLECEKTYALVEWISYTGKTRRHVFEVVKSTTEFTESVDIETITNQYDQRKNRRDSFTLRLEGLNRYDLWYYSDLITSSQVKVSLDGNNWYQVEVTAKKQTIPDTDAGMLNVLEIPINYRKYDTL